MKLLFLATILAYFIAPGTGLKCFRCGLSTSLCVFKATCEENEVCFSRNLTLSALGQTIYSSGCTTTDKCGKEVTDSLAGVSYKMTTVCCSVNYCNGAAAVKLSLLTGCIMALVWLTGFL